MTEIVMAQTPPVLHGPSEKERKYDRQLRLWAASGQAALESANLLLVNSGSGTVGVETLKNLVLPGIGRFTIVDNAVVSEADLGVNFFLDKDSLGKMRGQCSTELLLELNPEVQGDWYPKSEEGATNIQDFLATSPTFTMILYTFPIQPDDLALLQAYSREHKTPLVAMHSAGFYSYFRLHLPGAFPIVDTHPDETATTDLRLLTPWPELAEWARDLTRDIDNLDAHQHGHLPYVAILLHYLEKWRQAHDGANPSTYAEKTAFRRMVQDAQRRDNPEGGEENFEEAVAAVLKTVAPSTLPASLREVFEYKRTNPEESSSFWIIADAIQRFYEKHHCLPVPGNVPDMKAQSDVYIRLQNIYKAKARRDVDEVLGMVQAAPGGRDVDPAEVELFCKNAAFVKLINASGRDDGDGDRLATVAEEFERDKNAEMTMSPLSLLPIYLALRATSSSHVDTSSSVTSEQILAQVGRLVEGAEANERVAEASREVARAGGGELHNVSALTGGMVAQEVIKVITKQYVPVDNTCVFDGIGSRCQVFRL